MTRFSRQRRRGYFLWTAAVMAAGGASVAVSLYGGRQVPAAQAIAAPVVHAFNTVRPKLNLDNGPACLQRLATAKIHYVRLADWTDPKGCALDNTVRLSKIGDVSFDGTVTLTCRMAEQIASWERGTLRKAAMDAFKSPVASIQHIGTFNCRPIRGSKGLLSEHAYANAIDIKGFTLRDGSRISVAKDWKGTGARAEFLKKVAGGACRHFSTVLSPDDNRYHADHLHFDAGLWRNC